MTRAYLRLAPDLADRKASYPDGAFRAYVECLCHAEAQMDRGRFRNEKLLRVLLDRRARWIPFLVEHGDLILEADGRLYVDGWDEWQEGDVTVKERMARLYHRRSVRTPVKTDVNGTVRDPYKHSVAEHSGTGGPLEFPYPPKPGEHRGQHRNCSVCESMRKPA